jgi:TPR repeat/Glycosyltransferase family 9 (heptosyltransferase)/Tetratricopeptide repeat
MMADAYSDHWNAGNACYERGDLGAARDHFTRALKFAPDSAPARYNLGVVHRDLENWEAAWVLFIDVIARDKNAAGAYNNLAIIEEHFGLYQAAETHYRQAIALKNPFPDAHFNLGMLLLRLGRWREGFTECEARWQTSRFTPFRAPHPVWNGEQLSGTLLVHSEQGAGDAIQFVRFLPLAAERCGRILFICPERLHRLFGSLPGVFEMRGPGSIQYSEFQAYIPLLSLPRALGTTLESVPCRVPYLPPARRSPDLEPSSVADPRLRVGLVWGGSPTHLNDRHRSCALRDLGPLFEVPGIAYYSLQIGPQGNEVTDHGKWSGKIVDLREQLVDFSDTAAVIDQLDLTISVDTSVLHLAGALGRPIWGLLSAKTDWRWMLDRADSPWYPTLRLFRQTRLDDWHELSSRVAAALSPWTPGS